MKKYDIPEYEIEKFVTDDILTKSSSFSLDNGNDFEGGDLLDF